MNNTELVAYCGLYCGDCPFHRGKIADLARDLRKELRQSGFEKLASVARIKNYPECYQALGGMVRIRCKKACRDGGGNPFCKIRLCAREKGYAGCWECETTGSCKKLSFLAKYHDDAYLKNLGMIKKGGLDKFLTGKRAW